jgi:hypothetical protein
MMADRTRMFSPPFPSVIENNFGLALNYFLEHPYRRGVNADDGSKSQGLLKVPLIFDRL